MGLSHLDFMMILALFPLTYGLALLGKITQHTHLRLIKSQHGDIVPILVLYGPKLLTIERVRWHCELAVVHVVEDSQLTRGAVEDEREGFGICTHC